MKVKKRQQKQIAIGNAICSTCEGTLNSRKSRKINRTRVEGSLSRNISLIRNYIKNRNRLKNSCKNLEISDNLPLLNEFSIKAKFAPLIDNNTVNKVAIIKEESSCDRSEKLDLVRSRLSENYYHSSEVYKGIAKGLIREINLIKGE